MHADFTEEMKAAAGDPAAANKATAVETLAYIALHPRALIEGSCEHVNDVLADLERKLWLVL